MVFGGGGEGGGDGAGVRWCGSPAAQPDAGLGMVRARISNTSAQQRSPHERRRRSRLRLASSAGRAAVVTAVDTLKGTEDCCVPREVFTCPPCKTTLQGTVLKGPPCKTSLQGTVLPEGPVWTASQPHHRGKARPLAAAPTSRFHLLPLQIEPARGRVMRGGCRCHARLDLRRHGDERLLYVRRVLGRCLEKGDAQLVREFLGCSRVHRLSRYRPNTHQ